MLTRYESRFIHLEAPVTRNDIAIVVGLALEAAEQGHGCDACTWLGSDGDGYEYNGTWPVCNHDKAAPRSNLKSFPFRRGPADCFSLNHWCAAYIHLEDFEDSENFGRGRGWASAGWRLCRISDRFGRIRLNERNAARVKAALEQFRREHPGKQGGAA